MRHAEDHVEITNLILAWGLFRDQGRWSELSECFHPEGTIRVSWFAGEYSDFISRSKQMKAKSRALSKHLIWSPALWIQGDRAIGETSVAITGRAEVGGVPVDTVAQARFLDRIERRQERWRILERIAIYEKDRIEPVDHSPAFAQMMQETDFSAYPAPCRFLGARLAAAGVALIHPIIAHGSAEEAALMSAAHGWLGGAEMAPRATMADASGGH